MSSRVQDLVMRYLTLSRCDVRLEDGCLSVRFNPAPNRVHRITFATEYAREGGRSGGCELITVGSPFFHRMLNEVRGRCATTARLPVPDPEEALRRIQLGNCEVSLEDVEVAELSALKIYYLVTFSSNTRSQKVVEVAVDASGHEIPWLYSMPRDKYIENEKPRKLDKARLDFLLDRSAIALERRVAQELSGLRVESERRLLESIDRIQGYYAQLRDEATNEAEFARGASAISARPIRTGMSLEATERLMAEYDRLEALEIGREKARCGLRAEAVAIGIILLDYGLLRCSMRLRNEGASKTATLRVLPNGDFEGLSCEVCGRPIDRVYLCSCGHIVDHECIYNDGANGVRCKRCGGQADR
jgi:hypothetical protein